MSNKKILADVTEQAKYNIAVVDRAKFLEQIGVLQGLAWTAPDPYADAIFEVINALEALMNNECFSAEWEITHWMPLPEPPKED